MANVCIPKQVIEKLRTAIKSGAIDLEKLYDLGDAGRHELFSKYVGEDNVSLANSKFEEGMLVADKAAKSDYIRLADKEGFAKTGAAAEFGKNLLTNEQKTKLAVEKVNERIAKNQERIDFHEKSLNAAHPDDKPTIQYKIDKLKDIADRLNIKKDNLENPSSDRMLKKINSISRLLSPEEDKEMMSDLVKSKMGQELTPAEGQYIVNKTSELNELAKANKDSTLGVSGEYLNKKAALDSYIRSLNPEPDATSIMKDIVEIVKNNYITNISTPLKTAISSALNAPTSMLIRRFSNGLQGLPVNGEHFDEALKLWKEDEKIDKQAGSSLSTSYGINDVGSVLGSHNFIKDKSFKGVLDEFTKNEKFDEVSDNNKVSGVVSGARKALDYAAQKSHQLAIDIEHNWLFKKVYKTVFYDTLNLHSSLMAKTEGLAGEEATARSLEIMRDAAKIEPTTEAGKALRIDAQHAAAQVLNVDNTIASKFSVGVKNALNEAAPNIHIGTLLEPFAKIPANVIWKGIKNIPAIGIPDGISDIGFGAKDMGEENSMETRYNGAARYAQGIGKLISVLGSTAIGAWIASSLTPKDFRTDNWGNSFVNIHGLWINTEYFSRIAPNIAADMDAKKNANKGGMMGNIQSYIKGSISEIPRMPGADVLIPLAQTISAKNGIQKEIMGIPGSFEPAILKNSLKSHPFMRLFWGASGVETDEEYNQDKKAAAIKAAQTRAANK